MELELDEEKKQRQTRMNSRLKMMSLLYSGQLQSTATSVLLFFPRYEQPDSSEERKGSVA